MPISYTIDSDRGRVDDCRQAGPGAETVEGGRGGAAERGIRQQNDGWTNQGNRGISSLTTQEALA
jgi:hypothetical protein